MTRKVKGFTLVELAIVLAVIGLIAGMIFMSGGTLFKSSKTAKTIAIINDLGEAISQFKGTYKSFPGDMAVTNQIPNVHLSCQAGNDDELINENESACVIEHLFRAGLIKSDGIDDDGIKIIKSPFGGSISVSHPSASKANSVSWGIFVPVVIQIRDLPCDVIEEIDRKIDDGILNDGRARLLDEGGNLQATCAAGNILVVAL